MYTSNQQRMPFEWHTAVFVRIRSWGYESRWKYYIFAKTSYPFFCEKSVFVILVVAFDRHFQCIYSINNINGAYDRCWRSFNWQGKFVPGVSGPLNVLRKFILTSRSSCLTRSLEGTRGYKMFRTEILEYN